MGNTAARGRYRQLDDALIIATVSRLRDRITERFPESGLSRVANELLGIANEAAASVAYLRSPHWPIRIGAGIVIATMLTVIIVVVSKVAPQPGATALSDFVQAVEAAINDVILLSVAVFFLVTAESRVKRWRALAALHQLRSVVHIVDMHQLTKDPERLQDRHNETPSSPRPAMTAQELVRYLDYCSELLSLTSKVSALYVQGFNDAVVLGAVSEIETLAAGLSNKIWQKITLLQPMLASPARS